MVRASSRPMPLICLLHSAGADAITHGHARMFVSSGCPRCLRMRWHKSWNRGSNWTASTLLARLTRNAPRWAVFDRHDRFGDLDPDFKDVVLRFNPAGGLKFLAEHVLHLKPKFHYKMSNRLLNGGRMSWVMRPRRWRSLVWNEIGSLGPEEGETPIWLRTSRTRTTRSCWPPR